MKHDDCGDPGCCPDNPAALKNVKAEIMRLIREDFDPTPHNYEGRDWNDNAEEVASKIIAVASENAGNELRAENAKQIEANGILEVALAKQKFENAKLREALNAYHDAAQISAMMEGPRLNGWNHSQLARAYKLTQGLI
jgi:hypothetical protein